VLLDWILDWNEEMRVVGGRTPRSYECERIRVWRVANSPPIDLHDSLGEFLPVDLRRSILLTVAFMTE
jgi:hypothetical protein